jgi:hypothetical protein
MGRVTKPNDSIDWSRLPPGCGSLLGWMTALGLLFIFAIQPNDPSPSVPLTTIAISAACTVGWLVVMIVTANVKKPFLRKAGVVLMVVIAGFVYPASLFLAVYRLGVGIDAWVLAVVLQTGLACCLLFFSLEPARSSLLETERVASPPLTHQVLRFAVVGALGVALLGFAAYRYWVVVPKTTAQWQQFAYSSDAQSRFVSIGHLASSRDISALHRLLRDSNPDVARAAYDAVWSLHDERSIPVLIGLLAGREDDSEAHRLAYDFLNSENSALASAARTWAEQHGYTVDTMPGGGSGAGKW